MDEQPPMEQQPIATGQALPPTMAIGQPVENSQGLHVLPIGQPTAAPHPHVPAPTAVVDDAVHHQGAATLLHPHQIHNASLLVGPAPVETVSSVPLMRVRPALSQGLQCPSAQPMQTQLTPFGPPLPPPLGCSFNNVIIPNIAAKSVVWRYFGFPPKDGTVDVADRNFTRCRLCKGQIPYKGQTTNMLKHLESKHKEEYEEVRSKIGGNPKVGRIGHVNFVGASRGDSRKRLRKLDPDAADALVKTETLPAMSMAMESQGPQVGIIMGSDSDLPTMRPAAEILETFGVASEVTVVSAHRTPERMMEYAKTAHKRGIRVIIAGAGGAAHLPGMVAALTPLPVIGVPAVPDGSHLDGLDALMSIVQMPRGVPVATVAIGNSTNAGLLALRILGTGNPALIDAMLQYQDVMRQTVMEKVDRLDTQGWKDYQ